MIYVTAIPLRKQVPIRVYVTVMYVTDRGRWRKATALLFKGVIIINHK
jgi:hypothetical protein